MDLRAHEGAGLRRTRHRAFAALLFERVWPVLFGLLGVFGVFLTLSWFGAFAALPGLLRLALLAALVVAALAVLWRGRTVRLPTGPEIERRIEGASRLRHQPLRAQGESSVASDPFATALWREHQKRMAARLRDLSAGAPAARNERLDPFALRALLALLVATAFAFSFGGRGGRVADAFEPAAAPIAVAARVDAWVTPPGYTGRAPIFLTDAQGAATSGPVEVPAGSVLSVRTSDGAGAALSYTADGGAPRPVAPIVPGAKDGEAAPAPQQQAEGAPQAGAYDLTLTESGQAELSGAFRSRGSWRFTVTPDAVPTIAFAAEPTQALNGSLQLAYTVSDDYGVRQGRGEIALAEEPAESARPLVPIPEINLTLPRRTRGDASARMTSDLTESPYAGASVTLTLAATDDAGQTGRSAPKAIVLPERRFSNPLARAVIEQRRMLALDAEAAPKVVELLDAVTLRGEDFIENASDYLALRAVRTRIAAAENDEALVSAVDFMWQIALGIEDGNLSLAEKRLKDAQERLAEALEKGASDEEIDKLMAELRQAMQEYMQQLAEQMKNMPPMSQQQLQSGNMQEIRPQDLQRMMDRIEDLAKSGSKDAARELLAQMQEMMSNLQNARPMQGQPQGGDNAMQQQMDKLAELLQKQQALKDQTYDLGRRQMQRQEGMNGDPQQGQDGQPQAGGEQGPMSAEELQRQLDELARQQGQLQKDLETLQEAMKGMGMEPGEGFGDAGKAMGQAQGALGQGQDGEAVGRQGEAMEALRRGAQDMMQQMQQAMGQGEGQGQGQEGQMPGGYGPGRQQRSSDRDPLGRPRSTQGPDFGQDVKVPDEIDTQRARRILDAIRERLGDSLSPQMERDYLERLLRAQ